MSEPSSAAQTATTQAKRPQSTGDDLRDASGSARRSPSGRSQPLVEVDHGRRRQRVQLAGDGVGRRHDDREDQTARPAPIGSCWQDERRDDVVHVARSRDRRRLDGRAPRRGRGRRASASSCSRRASRPPRSGRPRRLPSRAATSSAAARRSGVRSRLNSACERRVRRCGRGRVRSRSAVHRAEDERRRREDVEHEHEHAEQQHERPAAESSSTRSSASEWRASSTDRAVR